MTKPSQEELYKTLDTIVPRVGEVKGMTQELRGKVISTAITALNSLTLKQVLEELIGPDENLDKHHEPRSDACPECRYISIRNKLRNELRQSAERIWKS